MLVKKGWTYRQKKRLKDIKYWKKLISGSGNIKQPSGSLFFFDFPDILGEKN